MAYIPTDVIRIKYIFNRKTFETYRVTGIEEVQAIRRKEYTPVAKGICFARLNHRLIFLQSFNTPSDGLTTGDIIVGYISDTPEMTKDSDSSNILTIAPDLMLYMSLKHASLHVQDDEGAQKWGMMAEASLALIQEQANKAEYSASPMVMPQRSFDDVSSCGDYGYAWIKN